ncbi:DUF2069 domain-containing protein [Steroidobacter sp. S1-65]|uniref:DUF2069 domain-containing protein n=2 Tax=Steroidobacter gossypii TaxID=2805490 RepID=A0ABS1X668_9GAMM|nr:DUF2069 domain-containing protein [Steroidobacter gossypii]
MSNTDAMVPTESSIAQRTRFAVLSAIGLLIAGLIAWRASDGITTGDVVLVVVLTLPVLFALPRLMRGHRRTYAWMTLAVTPFLIVALTEAVANPAQRIWAGICLMLAFVLFVLLIAYLRVTRPLAKA